MVFKMIASSVGERPVSITKLLAAPYPRTRCVAFLLLTRFSRNPHWSGVCVLCSLCFVHGEGSGQRLAKSFKTSCISWRRSIGRHWIGSRLEGIYDFLLCVLLWHFCCVCCPKRCIVSAQSRKTKNKNKNLTMKITTLWSLRHPNQQRFNAPTISLFSLKYQRKADFDNKQTRLSARKRFLNKPAPLFWYGGCFEMPTLSLPTQRVWRQRQDRDEVRFFFTKGSSGKRPELENTNKRLSSLWSKGKHLF